MFLAGIYTVTYGYRPETCRYDVYIYTLSLSYSQKYTFRTPIKKPSEEGLLLNHLLLYYLEIKVSLGT